MSESAGLRAGYMAAAALVRPVMNVMMRKQWEGVEWFPQTGFILCANHVSNLDPLAIGHLVYNQGRVPYFLAKAELFRLPVIGGLLHRLRQIPVERARGGDESLRTAVSVLADDGVILIYPEGTLTRDPELWPMKSKTGAARLALQTGAPVIPVAQWGIHEVLPRTAKAPSLRPRHTGRIRVGAPVDLSDLRDTDLSRAVLETATNRILDAITGELEILRGESAPAGRWNPRTDRREPGGTAPDPGHDAGRTGPVDGIAS